MLQQIKGFMGLTVGSIFAGEAMSNIGSAFTGSMRGIGNATQSLIGVGLLGHASSLFKWK